MSTTPRRRAAGPLVAACALTVALAGCGREPEASAGPGTPSAAPTPTRSAGPTPSRAPSPSATPRPSTTGVPDGEPTHVEVIGEDGRSIVDATIVPDGLDDAGILSPPAGVVGWYDEPGWPRPGHPGAAILAGHVGIERPDVFRDLPRARPGDAVTVTYDSGDTAHFVVVRSAGMPKDRTPADDSIWDADNPAPLLRLITCDPRTPLEAGHYEGNWVLWADLV